MDGFLLNGKPVTAILQEMAKHGNPGFVSALNPGIPGVLGCRVPDLRKLAKRIAATDEWPLYLKSAGTRFMEERLLYGLVAGYIPIRTTFKEYLTGIVDPFVKRINCWTVCDAFKPAGGAAYMEAHKGEWWDYLQLKMQSNNEYTLRFAVVMTMRYFISPEYLPRLFLSWETIHHPGYYVRMAVAWALSECFARYPNQTLLYLKSGRLEPATLQKALQKIIESKRVTPEVKSEIRQLKHTR